MGRIIVRYREEELVRQLKSNSRSAFEYLYDNYSPALYGVILKITKDEDRACDALQESFLKIWRSMASYAHEKGSLFTWMLNIARNTAIDHLRTDTRTESKVIRLDAANDQEPSTIESWNRLTYEMDVRAWVARLLPERRVPIELVYFQGYTHEEVAEKLSVPLGTVKSRIRRGLKELRSVFGAAEIKLKFA